MALTTALVVGTVASAAISANAAKKGAKAQQRGYDAATAEQARQYDQTREDYSPYRDAGVKALNSLSDPTAYQNDPAYQQMQAEGTRGLERSAAARGGAFSGNALRELRDFNTNTYANWRQGQMQLAGIGQNATNSTSVAGQNKANNVSNNLIGAGDARASGIAGQANAWASAASSLSNYGMYGGFGGMGGGRNAMAYNYRGPRYAGYA